MRDTTKGVLALLAALIWWGLSPLFYKAVDHIPAAEVLAHRTLWSAILFCVVLALQGRPMAPFRALQPKADRWTILLASVLVGSNWFLFIFAVQNEQALEASLGYFIFPLIVVLFGRVFFGERLGRAQLGAVGLMALAVLTLSVGLGVAPWMALSLAITFALYGVIKKRLPLGPVVSVTCEALLLSPLAAIAFGWLTIDGQSHFGAGAFNTVMLIACGPMTAGPLILFAYASRRISMSSVGLIFYLNPTLHFLIAALVFAEPVTRWHAIAFPMIWVALVFYSVASWRQDKAARKALSSS